MFIHLEGVVVIGLYLYDIGIQKPNLPARLMFCRLLLIHNRKADGIDIICDAQYNPIISFCASITSSAVR